MKAWLLILGCFAGLSGCYRHGAAHDPGLRPPRSELPPPHSVCFDLLLDGDAQGEECATITSSAGLWRMTGRRTLGPRHDTYTLEVSQKTRQPTRLDWAITSAQDTLRVTARVDDVWVHVGVTGGARPFQRKVAYAAGTHLDFASPLASAWPLALLESQMKPTEEVAVRTIAFNGATGIPKVELNRFRLHDRIDGHARFALTSMGRPHPEALWVKGGRLVRARQWRRGADGPVLEWRRRDENTDATDSIRRLEKRSGF